MEDSMFSGANLEAEKKAEEERVALALALHERRFKGQDDTAQVAAIAALLKALDTPISGRMVLMGIRFALDMTSGVH